MITASAGLAALLLAAATSPQPDAATEAERWLAGLEPIAGERVVLLVPRGETGRPDYRDLAVGLDRAAAAMAPRVPLAADALAQPIRVAVEPDFPSQARHAGRIGEAVPGGPADLHLVFDPEDRFAYHQALAALLLGRAPELAALPPALARGAALWLADGGWYGRPWREWLPVLAAADALPEAADLLAAADPPDGSAPLSTPGAAAVVDALRGDTLAAKLARLPGPPAVAALLARIRRQALAARPVPRSGDARAPTGGRPAGAAPAGEPGAAPLPFLRGASFAMLNRLDAGYHAPSVEVELDRLAALGADAVSLMPFAYQRDPRRPGLAFLNRRPESETDVGTVHAARRAHAHGFRVLWKPHLWISQGSWPGEVAMESEADWAAWWRGYRRFILHHALLAGWARAEVLCVGVELDATAGREAEWRRLVADIRRIFPGRLVYAANWDRVERVGFWDALDYVGVDSYHPLAAVPEATAEELAAGARRVVEELAAAARRTGRPLLLTEIGFAARRGAWVEPHVEGGEYSEADQAAAFRALFAALGRPPWLGGVFVWKAFSGSPGDRSGKPAEGDRAGWGDRGRWGDRPDFRFLDRAAAEEVRRYFNPRPG